MIPARGTTAVSRHRPTVANLTLKARFPPPREVNENTLHTHLNNHSATAALQIITYYCASCK